eukprot:TRINITY_DN15666_c0_g1_i10.p1 TRINITY_DN15666_c0_g1~~TRINITY_DN15666_c0_g1_i10.p1  ORF type:complete len:432 (-),score=53.26 TRINITY_DN15666_c0_g1_i10:230-1381(-)
MQTGRINSKTSFYSLPKYTTLTHITSPQKIFPKRPNIQQIPKNRKLIQVEAHVKLADITMTNILNSSGYIIPEVKEDTQVAVFAVFDKERKLQYVGFSKNIPESLRKVFCRRPDKAYFYKLIQLPEINQEELLGIREKWFEEVGGPPIGNRIAMERDTWEKPVDAGALSSRARRQAAEEKAKDLIKLIKTRGCNEHFVPKTELLDEGQVEMLLASSLSSEELQKQKEEMERVAQANRQLKTTVQEKEVDFQLFFGSKFQTNGGYWFDVTVTYDEDVTEHRVIVGDEYYAPYNLEPDVVVERAFQFLISIREPLHTEGILISNQFPVNYFSVSELCQTFPAFAKLYTENKGELPDMFWRWNRLHNYGGMIEDPQSLSTSIGAYE